MNPKNITFESSVLNYCFNDNAEGLDLIFESLEVADFAPHNQPIFGAFVLMREKGVVISETTLYHELLAAKAIEKVGGMERIAVLNDPSFGKQGLKELGNWVAGIKNASKLRRIGSGLAQIQEAVADESASADRIQAKLEALAFNLAEKTQTGQTFDPITLQRDAGRLMDRICDADGGIVGLETGLPQLDTFTGGLRAGQFVLVAARPSVGKSSLSLQIANHVANEGIQVCFLSLEMEHDELALVRACQEAGVSRYYIQSVEGNREAPPMRRLYDTLSKHGKTPFYVEKLNVPSLGPIQARVSRMKARKGLGLIVLDYLQLISGDAKKQNRNEEISTICNGLKNLASQMQVPIIVCAQLNREGAKPKEAPRLSQIRDSGAIEATADVALLLHRPNGDPPDNNPHAVDIIVAKNRTGPCGTISTTFVGKYQRFEPLTQEDFHD